MARKIAAIDSELGQTSYDSTKQFLPEDGYPSDNPPTETQNGITKILGVPETYKPNEEGKPFTGAGISANVGEKANLGEESNHELSYSWEQQGREKAETEFLKDTQTVNQNFQTNRQTLATNAVNYQTQADMMQYQNNQNAEKVGWTGGYVLDQNRQMDYLKASIQAQMYGAMELQKYGYDSSLAAARLSYDLNQQEYARQYYQDAVSAALSEAQLTGTYFSAEVKDMMSQLKVAELKKEDTNLSDEEREQARHLSEQIESWFSTNGISKQGVKTLAAWQAEQDSELAWTQNNWQMYNAALQAARTDVNSSATAFLKYTFDENGRPTIEYNTSSGGEIGVIDMYNMSADKLIEYMNQTYTDTAGNQKTAINEMARQQVQSYINYLYNDAVAKATTVKKDKEGNETSTLDTANANYISSLKSIKEMVQQINTTLKSSVLTDPTPETQSGPGGGPTPQKGTWTNASKIEIQGKAGTSTITLSGLSYVTGWDDKNSDPIVIKDAKDSTVKAVLTLPKDDLPKERGDPFSIFSGTSATDNVEIKTSPVKFEFSSKSSADGKFTNLVDKNSDTYKFVDANIDENITSFLKAFYTGTTGKQIKTGDIIVLNKNTILVYNEDNTRSSSSFLKPSRPGISQAIFLGSIASL